MLMADSHWRTRIPNADIGNWDSSLDLCNVNIQHVTIIAKGKTPRIRVRVKIRLCETAIITSKFVSKVLYLFTRNKQDPVFFDKHYFVKDNSSYNVAS